jgi:chorismate lyase/3-hydroxybenzoate synthase
VAAVEPVPPSWVREAIGANPSGLELGPHVSGVRSSDLTLLTTRLDNATRLPADALRRRVAETYTHLAAALAITGCHPIRYWNFIPSIGALMEPGLDRYMVFNAGRYEALVASSAAPDSARSLATASAVGSAGTALIVYCLASFDPGTPVENPRQTSPWLYSARYGPLPPWFSRATRATVNGTTRLLIGGTASIVGEDSRHARDMEGQLGETLENLAALVAVATPAQTAHAPALDRLVDVRAYVTAGENAPLVRRELERRCPRAARLEVVQASLCRPELLLEIEAVAEIP